MYRRQEFGSNWTLSVVNMKVYTAYKLKQIKYRTEYSTAA